ncbi:hypothetical protein FB45DRAFT_223838 [Roridomyces roridus]|uniref:DUF6534 domain-containing protein n=1 Tax=Roridomyces roridus TaxID=1738132 RepID=A0AAD7BDE6_9AGAR|nr:hypothetical protein FB45DRAFT_223838 [Roridomyces roridus]
MIPTASFGYSMSSPYSALPNFSQSFGAGLIGTWIAMGLYGLTISQTLFYFSNYPNDARHVKLLVSFLWILHTLHCVVICRLVYGYLILDAFNLELLTQNNWALGVSITLHLAVSSIVMVYLVVVIFKAASFRVKYLGWLFVALNGISIFVHAGFFIEAIVQVFRIKELVNSPDLATAVLSTAGTQVAADILIAGSLCIVLRSHLNWSQFGGTNSTIKSLMLCAISRGVVTATIALIELLALAIEPGSMWYIGCEFAIVGLYINALMVSLNSRNRMRARVESAMIFAKATSIGEDDTHDSEKTAV